MKNKISKGAKAAIAVGAVGGGAALVWAGATGRLSHIFGGGGSGSGATAKMTPDTVRASDPEGTTYTIQLSGFLPSQQVVETIIYPPGAQDAPTDPVAVDSSGKLSIPLDKATALALLLAIETMSNTTVDHISVRYTGQPTGPSATVTIKFGP